MDEKKMPAEVASVISNILQFLEKSEIDFLNGQGDNANEEADYENS